MINFREHLNRIKKEYEERLKKYGYQHARREYFNELWKLCKHNDKL